MNLVKGDTVIVIAGRDKGKTGVIQKVIPEQNRVVVENVNLRKKHRKPTQANPEGGVLCKIRALFSMLSAVMPDVSLLPATTYATRN